MAPVAAGYILLLHLVVFRSSHIYIERYITLTYTSEKKKKTAVEIVIFIDATPNALVYSDTLY